MRNEPFRQGADHASPKGRFVQQICRVSAMIKEQEASMPPNAFTAVFNGSLRHELLNEEMRDSPGDAQRRGIG